MSVRVVYQRKDCTWGWHLKADNGRIIATDGGQGYENESDARDMANRVLSGEFANAEGRIRREPSCETRR